MRIDYKDAREKLLGIFLSFEGHPAHPPSSQEALWCLVDAYVIQLFESGWSRKDIYNVVRDIDGDADVKAMPEEISDATGNYLTALVGQVDVSRIIHLPGEPSDVDDHARYVRG